jgi:hypothetical protein
MPVFSHKPQSYFICSPSSVKPTRWWGFDRPTSSCLNFKFTKAQFFRHATIWETKAPKTYRNEQTQWISELGRWLHSPSSARPVKPIERSEKDLTEGQRVREDPKPVNTLGFTQNDNGRGNMGSPHLLLVSIAIVRIHLRKFRTYS